jgi:hypothetical protein
MYLFIFVVAIKYAGMDSKKFERISRALSDPNRIVILEKFRSGKTVYTALKFMICSIWRNPLFSSLKTTGRCRPVDCQRKKAAA